MKDQLKKYLGIFLVLAVAVVISHLTIKNVFLANSPIIRPNLSSTLASLIKEKSSSLAVLINSLRSKPTTSTITAKREEKEVSIEKTQELKNIPFSPVAKGVYAKSDRGHTIINLRLNEIEFVEHIFKLSNGQEVKINIPKGAAAPPQELLDKIYR